MGGGGGLWRPGRLTRGAAGEKVGAAVGGAKLKPTRILCAVFGECPRALHDENEAALPRNGADEGLKG